MTYLIMTFMWLCLGFNTQAIKSSEYQDKAKQLTDCWYNWRHLEESFEDKNFSPMIWKPTNKQLLNVGELAIKYPGRTWLIYNEPEGKDQANTPPEVAAEWFEKTYKLIKIADPTAKIGCCGNMVRQESFIWLDKFVKVSTIKPDFWHIHVYALNKSDWKSFADYWWWWNSNNWNLDTSITETCGMYADDQIELLKFVSSYRHPKLLSVFWFSAYEEPLAWKCHLFDNNAKLTSLGQAWVDLMPKGVTPTPEPATPTAIPTPTPSAIPTLTITPTSSNTPINTPSSTPTVITPLPTVSFTPTPSPTHTPTHSPTQQPTGVEPTVEPANPIILFLSYYLPISFK